MTKKSTDPQDQALKDEAEAERRYRAGLRVPKINLSPLAVDAPSENTPFVQAANTDPETKKLFEALIDEIRRQVAAGGEGGSGEGTQGPQGAAGADSTVPGPQGPQGEVGPQGPAGAQA